ncbi:MAG TPA: hypothetical protein VF017_02985 [Thermoanaerobaculia bacterium]|nr:hypothetical protein [Thermoanaerobaculia bacterium]
MKWLWLLAMVVPGLVLLALALGGRWPGSRPRRIVRLILGVLGLMAVVLVVWGARALTARQLGRAAAQQLEGQWQVFNNAEPALLADWSFERTPAAGPQVRGEIYRVEDLSRAGDPDRAAWKGRFGPSTLAIQRPGGPLAFSYGTSLGAGACNLAPIPAFLGTYRDDRAETPNEERDEGRISLSLLEEDPGHWWLRADDRARRLTGLTALGVGVLLFLSLYRRPWKARSGLAWSAGLTAWALISLVAPSLFARLTPPGPPAQPSQLAGTWFLDYLEDRTRFGEITVASTGEGLEAKGELNQRRPGGGPVKRAPLKIFDFRYNSATGTLSFRYRSAVGTGTATFAWVPAFQARFFDDRSTSSAAVANAGFLVGLRTGKTSGPAEAGLAGLTAEASPHTSVAPTPSAGPAPGEGPPGEAATAASPLTSEPMRVLRVGYTTFESPSRLRREQEASLSAVERLLGWWVRTRKPGSRIPPEVDLVVGNYYQIFTWLQQGQLDAAVVSPLTAALLAENRQAVPLLELMRRPPGSEKAATRDAWCPGSEAPGSSEGHWPIVAAKRPGGPSPHPREDFQHFVDELFQDTLADEKDLAVTSGQYRALLVSHLSTTGFLAPLTAAARGLAAQLDMVELSRLRKKRGERFWDLFFERAHFVFDHNDPASLGEDGKTLLRFSYSDRNTATPADGFGCWEPLFDDALAPQPIPNDFLVLSSRSERRLQPDLSHLLAGLPASGLPIGEPGGYQVARSAYTPPGGLRPAGAEALEVFRATYLAPLLRAKAEDLARFPLVPRLVAWFQDGRYAFKPADLIRFLAKDRAAAGGELSVVLPGGGVKAAYQAQIFDKLWNGRLIRSGGGATEPLAQGVGSPIPVTSYVGTSGGALMGLLAAQLPPDQPTINLTERFRGQLTSSLKVFPFFNQLRWGSLWVLIALLSLSLSYSVRSERSRLVPGATLRLGPPPRKWIGINLMLPILLAPLLMALVMRRENHVGLGLPGLVYLLIVLVAHVGSCCTVCKGQGDAASRFSPRVLSWLPAILLVGAASVAAFWVPTAWHGARRIAASIVPGLPSVAADQGAGLPSATLAALVGLSFWLVQLGVFLDSCRRREIELADLPRQGRALAAVVLHLVLTHLLVGMLVLSHQASWLEVTGGFWLWLLLCGGLVAAALAWWGSRNEGPWTRRWLFDGFEFLIQERSRGWLRTTPRRNLLGLLATALALWGLFLGNALYNTGKAFELVAETASVRSGDGRRLPPLYATLVVTASALEPSNVEGQGTWYPAGASYFCMPAQGACKAVGLPRWHVVSPDALDPAARLRQVLDPVFASASPFPVFPPHLVELPGPGGRQTAVAFVDGGFAHLEPLEAARLLESRQVLVLRSRPDPAAFVQASRFELFPIPSRLSRGLVKLVPFLFEQSQQLDRSIAQSMVVAVIEPSADDGAFPSLTDFRPQVVERMIRLANRDWHRLVGKVESWGLPVVFERLHPPAGDAAERGGLRAPEPGPRPSRNPLEMSREE